MLLLGRMTEKQCADCEQTSPREEYAYKVSTRWNQSCSWCRELFGELSAFARWRTRFNVYGMHCTYCGQILSRGFYHLDHMIPLVLGGSDHPSNRQALCPPCNRKKSSWTEGELIQILRGKGPLQRHFSGKWKTVLVTGGGPDTDKPIPVVQ